MTARWTPQESDDLDRRIRAMRKPDPADARAAGQSRRGVQTSDYTTGLPRGSVTPEDLQRRKAMDRAMQRRANRREQ